MRGRFRGCSRLFRGHIGGSLEAKLNENNGKTATPKKPKSHFFDFFKFKFISALNNLQGGEICTAFHEESEYAVPRPQF